MQWNSGAAGNLPKALPDIDSRQFRPGGKRSGADERILIRRGAGLQLRTIPRAKSTAPYKYQEVKVAERPQHDCE